MVTASGPSPISLKRIIFRQCRFMAALDCSTCTAFRSQRIARLNCCISLGDRYSLVDVLYETVDCSVVQKESSVTVLLTNHTTPGHSIETEDIHVHGQRS